ncbi:hypothetical protein APASM_5401 [Actinosynnema pretiosum subsp. pretiosum]|nr:hypothetical protein APASM_5401 [Actinosynnema pretiosum subsp. pretiosum]
MLGAGSAEGLAAIHEHVVHRDLKAGDVLLSRSGPRIIDFGVARALDGSPATTRATPPKPTDDQPATGLVLGLLAASSPSSPPTGSCPR